MGSIPNRRERRAALKRAGILKQKGKLPYKQRLELDRESFKRGNEIHLANTEEIESIFNKRLEEAESKKISEWREQGYSSKEIDILREAFALTAVKDKQNHQADKKESKRLIQKAADMKRNRV